MTNWKIDIKSVDGEYATVKITNNIDDATEMVNEIGRSQVGFAIATGENERTIFPYATIISIKVTKVEE